MRNLLALFIAGLAAGCAVDDLAIGELEQGLLLESDKLLSPVPAWEAWFGWSIELGTDQLIVGAPYQDEKVRVFSDVGGNWQLAQVLEVDTSYFGSRMALDGDRLAVTSRHWDRWAVHIFERVDDLWFEAETILAPYPVQLIWAWPEPFERARVALEGDHLVVGNDTDWDGALFAYHRQADGSWLLTQKIDPPHPDDRLFGTNLAMSGGRLLVSEEHRVYVFRLEGTSWKHEALLLQTKGDSGNGPPVYSLDLDGDVAMVGFQAQPGPYHTLGVGEVRVYKRINGAWNNIQGLLVPEPTAIDIEGTVAVVGAAEASCGRTLETGCAYLYRSATASRSTWGLVDSMKASDGAGLDRFGQEVALSGSAIAIGAPHDSSPFRAGAVYRFDP